MNRAYKVERYTVHVTLDMKAQRVYVDERIDLRMLSDVSQLQFDLQDMVVQAIRDSRTNLPFNSSYNHLTVGFPRPLKRSRHHRLRITMSGKPSKGLVFEGDEAFTVYDTSHWLAVDHRPGDLHLGNLGRRNLGTDGGT